jgi:type II secretory pathway component PulF
MLVTLELVRNTVHNKAFAVDIDRVRDYVERGESIEEPLRQSKVIPGIVTDMLVTGEETGSLEQIADHVAESYEEEVDISINTLSELVVPVLTVIIGIIVVAVAFAVFVPMIDMVDQLSQRS